MWPIDISDWILIVLFVVGSVAWVKDRRERSKAKVAPPPKPPKKQAWEVKGARTSKFSITQLSKLLAEAFGTDAKEEEQALKRAVGNGDLDDPALPEGDTDQPSYRIGWHGARKVKLKRAEIRRYFRSAERPIPEGLKKRFDDA